MNRILLALFISLTPAAFVGAGSSTAFKYPAAPTSNQVDDYHGTKVADPYRPLENPDAPESRKWIEAENELTFDFLKSIPERDAIKARLTALWDYEKFGVPFREKNRYFISKNSGLQNQNVLYTATSLTEQPRQLLDPNTLAKDGTIALSGVAVSDDSKFLAYGLATAGSDWQQWKARDVETGKDRDDQLDWIKFSGATWMKDGSGFFYSRYDKPDEKNKLRSQVLGHKIFFHKLGTAQSDDRLVYERRDQKEWIFNEEVTDDGHYLVITVQRGTDPKNRIFYKDLVDPNSKVIELLDKADAKYDFLGNEGPLFAFETDLNAPLGRIISIDTSSPRDESVHSADKPLPPEIKELVPESADKLENVAVVGDHSSPCI
jgi:prolyl oligopeptidase